MPLAIHRYQEADAPAWDAFVGAAVNGTLFHTRRFLGYHPPGRFEDASVLVRDGERLVAVVPACVRGDGFFSHTGSSYGGPVVHPDHFRVSRLAPIVDAVIAHYGGRLAMRLSESIFSQRPLDPLLYLLGRNHAIVRELGVCRPLDAGDPIAGIERASTRSAVRQLLRAGFEVTPAASDDELAAFHALLVDNLRDHGATPTHTLDEMRELCRRLGDDQVLLLGRQPGGPPVAGVWLMAASRPAWHTFYIARHADAPLAAVPCALVRAMELSRAGGARYLNFGICTEDRGRVMNLGLFDFKQSLGGEAVNRYLVEPA
jgi:hypothetical protein